MLRKLLDRLRKPAPVTRPTNPCPICDSPEWCRCEFDYPFGKRADEEVPG